MLALEDLLESGDGVLEGDEGTLHTGEGLGDSEGLRHETLDLTSALDGLWLAWVLEVKEAIDWARRGVCNNQGDPGTQPSPAPTCVVANTYKLVLWMSANQAYDAHPLLDSPSLSSSMPRMAMMSWSDL